ncbi:hypothetical protein JOB18_025952 [Solea senegalensis]|uniref:Reverse transcriptase domain-containing protein n=1 Tax=Solea senegalensis TaxID=28829 RepID=A0AAV6PDP2_SOLSE|nr:hypothetical protein JOB18_025952 [Solea senegalensis]
MDVSVNNHFKQDTSRGLLIDIIKKHDLVDVWRITNPFVIKFSRHQITNNSLKQSRIDFTLAGPSAISKISTIDYQINTISDHNFIKMSIFPTFQQKNGGVWCFNNSLLQDPQFIKKINNFLQNVSEEMRWVSDAFVWWDEVKKRIKRLSINYSKHKRWLNDLDEKDIKQKIEVELSKIAQVPNRDLTNYIWLKEQLSNHYKIKCAGAITRSRVQAFVEGERCTSYFLGLEKQLQSKVSIKELKNSDGNSITNLDEILTTVHSFFQQLYSSSPVRQYEQEMVTKAITNKLSTEDKVWCDQPLTTSEIEATISGLHKNKSPGLDGLTTDFFQAFKDKLSPMLQSVFQEIDSRGYAPETLTSGLITIVYKNKGDKTNLQNYRPISLLNTDYKILTKALANKLKTAFVCMVSMSHNINHANRRVVRAYAQVKCALTDFWQQASEEAGFEQTLIGLVAEPLALLINQNQSIQGIRADNGAVCKMISYADDTNIMVKDEKSLNVALDIIDNYCAASGAKINEKKSTIMYCGAVASSPGRWQFREEKACVRVLGVYLGCDGVAARDQTWHEVLEKIKKTLGMWKMRKLTLKDSATTGHDGTNSRLPISVSLPDTGLECSMWWR